MISKFKKALLVLGSALFLFSCQKDVSDNTGTPNNPSSLDLTTKVTTAKISGYVTDENNNPVIGAQVTAGTANTTTDDYGYFQFRNTEVVKNAAVVTVTKAGYFKGIKTFIARSGKSANFRIKLLPKTNAGTISATAGGEVALTNGMKINFPVNAIVNASSGAAYSGTVNVAAQWLDPSSNELNMTMPGDLRGLDASGAPKILTTYGMAAVELTGASGEQLQIAAGKKATLTMPLPTAAQASAPASIPLWHFNETKGLWEEEGSATKTGNTYVGEVSHFSFWNCDVPSVYVHVDLTLVDANNHPIPNAFVRISRASNPYSSGWGVTDSSGYVGGAVPGNENLVLEVYSYYNCGNASYTQNFTTTTTDLSLGNITISNASNIYANVSGSVTDCSNNAVTNGYVMVFAENRYSRYDVDASGNFSFDQLICNNSSAPATIIAVDANGIQQSAPVTFVLSSGPIALGTIQACASSIAEFLTWSVDGGTSTTITAQNDSLMQYGAGATNVFAIAGNSINPSNRYITFYVESTGIAVGSTQILQNIYTDQLNNQNLTVTNNPVVHITEYGVVGEFIAANFSANVLDNTTSQNHTVTCSFRVRRNF